MPNGSTIGRQLEPRSLFIGSGTISSIQNELKYKPLLWSGSIFYLVPAEGFEPPTFCSEDRRSNPLSYAGMVRRVIITDYGRSTTVVEVVDVEASTGRVVGPAAT